MKNLLFLFLITFSLGCSQDKQMLVGETAWQKEQNANFKDATKSPLKDKDRKNFKTLDFYKFDSTYVVTAELVRTPDSQWFNMETTTNRVSKERVFGILKFKLNGQEHELNVYQGKDLMNDKEFMDYLLLPFLDDTNGEESYSGGRYIDLRIPEGNTIVIDFNKAYNPYCAYNKKYSCPIVPRENYVATEIKAGIKDFKKN